MILGTTELTARKKGTIITKRLHFPYCRLKQEPNMWENQKVFRRRYRYAILASRADVFSGTIMSANIHFHDEKMYHAAQKALKSSTHLEEN
jgi:hypothetical protein